MHMLLHRVFSDRLSVMRTSLYRLEILPTTCVHQEVVLLVVFNLYFTWKYRLPLSPTSVMCCLDVSGFVLVALL